VLISGKLAADRVGTYLHDEGAVGPTRTRRAIRRS
jgi:hypothetical protein